jgi:hypothetical protein
MASERQIAANRRNAQKSTGPRSVAGKKRASRNAYRHGFAAGRLKESRGETLAIEALAYAIAAAATGSVGAAADPEILAHARVAARAEQTLTKIRARKAAIVRALMGASMTAGDRCRGTPLDTNSIPGCDAPAPDQSSSPSATPSRAAFTRQADAGIGDALTTLLKLERYETRASAGRDRAIAQIVARHIFLTVVRRRN